VNAFETVLLLLFAAVLLAAIARRVGAPYPAFLAMGGAVLAFLPHPPAIVMEPELALALFVAPVLLDAAYDASPRDLKDNWIPLTALVVGAVGVTTVAVAGMTVWLMPSVPWAAAIVLGAVVAPPDAAAATAVLRQLRPPHRIMTILGGESLLNDATALLIYRVAVGAAVAKTFEPVHLVPAFLLGVAGSAIVGPALAWLNLRLMRKICDVPTSVILQFVSTFGVWILAERLGLSAVLTMVCYAVAIARRAPEWIPANMRVSSYAVWETAVFVLNVLAFVMIGLQIRPVLGALEPAVRTRYFFVAGAVLVTVIVVRIGWVLACAALMRWSAKRRRGSGPHEEITPSLGGSLIVSWCGMRGIVTLAAALALPAAGSGSEFPFRDLIVLTSFSVVIGTLLVQGLTLRPLLVAIDVHDDDLVNREVALARTRAITSAVDALGDDASPPAAAVREELNERLAAASRGARSPRTPHDRLRRDAVANARQTLLGLRDSGTIGDDAFHVVEEELDWLEMSGAAGEP
jgi:CPA1 family monovalent cation:H+ antiporter